jgi:RimJ/RimL family protein N-acetyltransferase
MPYWMIAQPKPSRPMTVQRLNPSHAIPYRSMMLEGYANFPEAFTSTVEERAAFAPEWWEQRLAVDHDTPEIVIGAFHDDELAGACGLSFEARSKTRHKATLFGMYVAQRYQRLGLGRAIVIGALAYARQRPGVTLVHLTVTDTNQAAVELYRACGFESYGVEPRAIMLDGHYLGKLHMWCPLQPDA